MADESKKEEKKLAPWFADKDDVGYGSRPVGRPGRLTYGMIKRIATMIEMATPVQYAAMACGISKVTYYKWLKIGNASRSGIYYEFVNAIHRATAIAHSRSAIAIASAQQGDWRAAAFVLERRFPKEWGKHDKLEIDATTKITVEERRQNMQAVVAKPHLVASMLEMAEMMRPKRGASDIVDGEVVDQPKESESGDGTESDDAAD